MKKKNLKNLKNLKSLSLKKEMISKFSFLSLRGGVTALSQVGDNLVCFENKSFEVECRWSNAAVDPGDIFNQGNV